MIYLIPLFKLPLTPIGLHSFILTGKKKDTRNVLKTYGLKGGIFIAYVHKANRPSEEAFLAWDMSNFFSNPDILEELDIHCIMNRRGADGITPMLQHAGTTYPFRMFVCCIGEDMNTLKNRKEFGVRFATHLSKTAIQPNYIYPKKCVYGGDETPTTYPAVSSKFLDSDVIGLMVAAYDSVRLEDLMDIDSIMKSFWVDPIEGREIMQSYLEDEEAAEMKHNNDNTNNNEDDDNAGANDLEDTIGDNEDSGEDDDNPQMCTRASAKKLKKLQQTLEDESDDEVFEACIDSDD